jgi:hypothetical protein
MKTIQVFGLFLFGLVTLTSSGQQTFSRAVPASEPLLPQQDVRLVGGKEVDLASVHQWLAHPVGERPLKHWKRLQILEVKGNLAGYTRCVVKTEENVKTEFLMANLPPGPAAYLQSARQQSAAILALRAQVEADQKAIDGRLDWYLRNPPTWSSVTSGGTTVADTPRGRTQDYVSATRKLEEDQKNLRLLELKHQELLDKGAAQTSVLAMFTGQSYARTQIWECGRKK